ncbi:transglycosylase SLT domain-containing protein [Candidatus Pacearchaeota archaeon]|nr:transglycosylase SLT domain-containing protein [Candidatus Pacearchaeota archaeon]
MEYTIGNGPESRNPDAGEFYHNLHAYNFDAFRDAIISVESNGNPNAHNKTSGARGLMQITPKGGLAEWNKCNPHKRYSEKDLFDEEINRKIGSWYIQKIVQYLEWYNIEPTIENVASVYNCGIGNFMKSLKNNTNLPAETQEYFRKVRARTDSGIKPQVKERNWERR